VVTVSLFVENRGLEWLQLAIAHVHVLYCLARAAGKAWVAQHAVVCNLLLCAKQGPQWLKGINGWRASMDSMAVTV
jgi:hypothetical protein